MTTGVRWLTTWGGVLTLIGLVAPGVPPARGADEDETLLANVRKREERDAARCERFLADLQLTRGQARRLIPILEQAAKLHVQRYEDEAQLLTEMRSAYGAFAAEDRLNQGFTPEVERRTARVHHREIAARDRYTQELLALEPQVTKLLTPVQRKTVEAREAGERGAPAEPPEDSTGARLGALRRTLEELESRKHPRLGLIGRDLLDPSAYEGVCARAELPMSGVLRQAIAVEEEGTAACPRAEFERQRGELAQIRKEINNWNLINGLYLSESQIQQIVDACEAADLAYVRRKGGREAEETIVALEQRVREILNLGQRQVLDEYKPCLLPPKNLKDPVRVGQAKDNSAYEQWLERARVAEGPQLDAAIADALEREVKHAGALSRTAQKQREAALRKAARQAAKMDDSEFALSKSELAARLAPPDRAQELRTEIEALEQARGRPGRVARFMLNADFLGQLRTRAAQLAAGTVLPPADLAAGPQAENCEKGCALRGKPAKKK